MQDKNHPRDIVMITYRGPNGQQLGVPQLVSESRDLGDATISMPGFNGC